MQKPKLLIFMILLGLVGGGAAGYNNTGDFIGTSSMAGIAIGAGVLFWMIIAYHLSD